MDKRDTYHLKTLELCDEAVRMVPRLLEFVQDTLKQKGYATGRAQQPMDAVRCS